MVDCGVRIWLEQRPDLRNNIKLFGAPFEAEAQCVQLEKHGLVDETISRDSDIIFHGGVQFYSGYNTCTSNGLVKYCDRLKIQLIQIILHFFLVSSWYQIYTKFLI